MSDLDQVRMKSVRPFWTLAGRVTILPSEATEEEHSGIVIPTTFNGDGGLKRGVVIEVSVEGGGVELDRGVVVFYRGEGIKIGDVILVDLANVYAYEAD